MFPRIQIPIRNVLEALFNIFTKKKMKLIIIKSNTAAILDTIVASIESI